MYPSRFRDYLPLLIVAAVGLVMRLWNLGSMSLSNDELSALYRLQFDSFKTLWNEGVRLDGHPAFVQTFLFAWIKIFPPTPFWLRLPFALAGTTSIILIYFLGKKWFGFATGLFSAIALAFLEYPLLYSQLARPYSFGLCFVLAMALAWSNIVFHKDDRKIKLKYWILAITFTWLSMLTHYFSFFQVLLIGVVGLFILKKTHIKPYILAAIISSLLFIPHIPITLFQLKVGGVGGWLAAPGYEFMFEYLFYLFNGSVILISVLGSLLFVSFFQYSPSAGSDKHRIWMRILALSMFLIPLFTGLFYSRNFAPVLQNSVLIFSVPFLLIFIFSFTENLPDKLFRPSALLFGLCCFCSTILPVDRNYYNRYHFGEFKSLTHDFEKWKTQYENDITQIVLVTHPFYLNYYLSNEQIINRYYSRISYNQLPFREYISNLPTKYLSIGWTNQYFPPELPGIVKTYFPYCVETNAYVNAGSYLFSKEKMHSTCPSDTLFYSLMDFRKFSDDTTGHCNGFMLTDRVEFSPSFSSELSRLILYKYNVVHAVARFRGEMSENCDLQLVLSIERDDQNIFWAGRNYQDQCNGDKNNTIHLSERMDKKNMILEKDILKIYVWNPEKCVICLESITVTVTSGNPILYGYD